ncbi:MAG: PadR family transcriptional regulator [Candidatus Hodarchaeales archaeon]|jgi:PadR family transcriptional regulator PadR
MISNIKGYDLTALIESEPHRKFLENFESDLLRGIGKISILKIIKNYGKEGVYGYQLLKDLKEKTNNMLIIKEGTLYPLLRNLEKWESKGISLSLIKSYKLVEQDRPRKYYYLTEEGEKILSHLEGFFSKLLEAISALNDFQIILNEEKYIYCQNCKNKVDYSDSNINFCEICGFNIKNKNLEN